MRGVGNPISPVRCSCCECPRGVLRAAGETGRPRPSHPRSPQKHATPPHLYTAIHGDSAVFSRHPQAPPCSVRSCFPREGAVLRMSQRLGTYPLTALEEIGAAPVMPVLGDRTLTPSQLILAEGHRPGLGPLLFEIAFHCPGL